MNILATVLGELAIYTTIIGSVGLLAFACEKCSQLKD